MNDHLILIDVNAVGYAAMYQPALARLSHQGQSTAAIHGATASVLSIMKAFPEAIPLILWDGHADWRYHLLPTYKATRNDDPKKVAIKKDYRRQSEVLKRIFTDMGLPQAYCPRSEADDLAGHICRNRPEHLRITMATRDTDWLQAVGEGVTWMSTRTREQVGVDNFTDYLAKKENVALAGPDEYLLCKAMAGDTSDTIDGVPGVGLVKAKKLLDKYDGLNGIYAAAEGKAEKLVHKVMENREIIDRNLQLMDWKQSPPPSADEFSLWSMRREDPDVYEDYGLSELQGKVGFLSLDRDRVKAMMTVIDHVLP